MSVVYYEGKFLKEEEVRIPPTDRGLLCGDGAYATIQVREGTPLFLEMHLAQLRKQCQSFQLIMPPCSAALIDELIAYNQAERGIWRLKIVVTGGDGSEQYLPERQGRLLVFLKPHTPVPWGPLTLGLFPTPYACCHASFKSLAHLNRYYVMQEAKRQKRDDCVTVTEKGSLLETAFGNLLFIEGMRFLTPSPQLPLYFGITLQTLLEIGRGWGFSIEYLTAPLDEIPEKAAPFRTNTLGGARPILQIGERLWQRQPELEERLLKAYEARIKEQQRRASPATCCL